MIGSVAGLWRFPVKSMQGEQLSEITVTGQGVFADRVYGIFDAETGEIASAKRVGLFPDLMMCRASFIEPPRLGYAPPPVRIDLPDGQSIRSDGDHVDDRLSTFFQREVRLLQAAPGIHTYKQHQAEPGTARSTGRSGEESVAPGAFRDACPVSILTTSTLARLTELGPQSRFDPRRFRMNIIIKTEPAGFVENDWIGHGIDFAGGTRLEATQRDSRCVMTTLPQDNLPKDPDILKIISRHNRIPLNDGKLRPCAGIYAQVADAGLVGVGERVKVTAHS